MIEFILIIIVIAIVVGIFVLVAVLIDKALNDNSSNHTSNHVNNSSKHINYSSIKIREPTIVIPPINEIRGIQGENTVKSHLKKLIKNDEYLFSNLLLPLKNGYKTEIDCVLLSKKGIFCIEIKNWIGHISGTEESEYWIQEYDNPNMENKQHRNPYKQNEFHCRILEEKLDNDFRVNNIVLFPNIEDRKELFSNSTYDIRQFTTYYLSLRDELYDEDIEDIASKLKMYVATEEQLKEHKDQMKKTYGNN